MTTRTAGFFPEVVLACTELAADSTCVAAICTFCILVSGSPGLLTNADESLEAASGNLAIIDWIWPRNAYAEKIILKITAKITKVAPITRGILICSNHVTKGLSV